MQFWRFTSLGLALTIGAAQLWAAEPISERIRHVQNDISHDASQKIQAVLERYCSQHCQLLDVQVEVHETLPDNDEIGFESLLPMNLDAKLEVQAVTPSIQIDNRVLPVDRSRLEALIRNKIKSLGPEIIERIDIQVEPLTPDQLQNLPPDQVMVGKHSEGGIQIQDLRVFLTLDENLPSEDQSRILRIMKAQTRFVSPIDFQVELTAFPDTALDKKRKAQDESQDPYGLEKLRHMLTMFKELAGTKEIIQTMNSESRNSLESKTNSEKNEMQRQETQSEKQTASETTTKSDSMRDSTKESSADSKSSISAELNKESKESESRRLDSSIESLNNQKLSSEEIAAYAAGFILLITLMAIALMKISSTNRTAREMVVASAGASGYGNQRRAPAPMGGDIDMEPSTNENYGGPRSDSQVGFSQISVGAQNEKALQTLKLAQLKQELIQQFMEQPRIAKETFTRLLKDEGVAETAKYVHIFGQLIIFELLNDSSLKRDLYELSEYYHRSSFKFDMATEQALLDRLKIIVTASEIRLLANNSSDRFAFLGRLDAQQIYNLIADERSQVQSIVLTQLDRKLRSAVFEMYEGDARIRLLEELSQAEAIPREFLFNVAQALQKKIQSRSEFDTEQLRSSDILLDLLERSDLSDQQQLMQTLEKTNPETARGLKLKLVTIEMMPYLKDGHMLELILGMEREDLLAFLVRAPESIRDLLLRKAPEELAQSWIEDIRNSGVGVDEHAYRICQEVPHVYGFP
ncbi:MAG: hypothetical protein NTX25_06255 [Proteobacteria bacterium]|nr:hypothetical protein [Pseudomonadota bacterium]